jgi:hypothetical protein
MGGLSLHTAWPPRSPDFNPLDFLHLGVSKIPCVCSSRRQTRGTSPLFRGACQTTRNYPDIFEGMLLSMLKRVDACMESRREHSGNLLQIQSFSYNS